MFLKFYGLREEPFGVTPDPRFLYLTPSHREAQATLEYGIRTGRGFAALVARPGMGKTTLLFHVLQQYATSAKTAFLFQTQCDSREFMRYLLSELGIDLQITDVVHLHEEFNRLLLRESHADRSVIIVVDEAQNLSPSVLETVRLLSDFETPRRKLLHIILAGQPELSDKLASPSLVQLRQRITHFVRLDTFTPQQTDEYIDHRLRVAGYASADRLFSLEARGIIQQRSEGVPRIINNLCFNALSLGYASDKKTIDAAIAQEASLDLDIETFNWQVRGLRPAEAAAPLYKNNPYPAFIAPTGAGFAASPAAPLVRRAAAAVPARSGGVDAPALAAHPAIVEPAAAPPQAAAASAAPALQPAPVERPVLEPAAGERRNPQTPSPLALEVDLDALAQDYALLEFEAMRRTSSVLDQPEKKIAAPAPAPLAVVEAEPDSAAPAAKQAAAAAEPQPAIAIPLEQPARKVPGPRKYLITAGFLVLLVLAWQITRAFTLGGRAHQGEVAEASSPTPQPNASVDEPVVVADEGAEAVSDASAVTSVINVIGEVPSLGRHRGRVEVPAEKTDGLVRRVDPIYPEAAKEALLQGSVVIDAAVARDGSLRHLRVVSGDPLLAQSAIDAVRGWRYRPRSGRGADGPAAVRINLNFVLSANRSLAAAGANH
jgi:TonB family protein